jgi:hypothetical protein
MRTAMALLVVFLVGAPVPGQGKGYYDGNRLMRGLVFWSQSANALAPLSDKDQLDSHIAYGYVLGAAEAGSIFKLDLFCSPDNAVQGQLIDVVYQYLERHPERRHQGAAGLVCLALAEAFPCAKAKTP